VTARTLLIFPERLRGGTPGVQADHPVVLAMRRHNGASTAGDSGRGLGGAAQPGHHSGSAAPGGVVTVTVVAGDVAGMADVPGAARFYFER
jgi:hypothetical protein